MKVTINIPNEKIKVYAEMYKLSADEDDIPDTFDDAVERAASMDEYELDLSKIEDGKKIMGGIAIMVVARIALEEEGI